MGNSKTRSLRVSVQAFSSEGSSIHGGNVDNVIVQGVDCVDAAGIPAVAELALQVVDSPIASVEWLGKDDSVEVIALTVRICFVFQT